MILALLGLGTASSCSQQMVAFDNADVNGFIDVLASGDVQLLDVRTADEYNEGHLAGALNIDVKQSGFVDKAIGVLDTTRTVAVYCRSGRRSVTAAKQLAAAGCTVVNLEGGIEAWQKAGRPVTRTKAQVDRFKTPGGMIVELHAVMHGSIRIVAGDCEIEVDPVTHLGKRQSEYALCPKADFILVTHEHGDHFDRKAIEQLTKSTSALVTNARCADMLGYGQVMANGDTTTLTKGITLQAVPAYNTTEGHLQFHPKGRDNGFVLTIDGLRIYIAGDTEDVPEMAQLTDVDIAFLPCNQPYTMTVDQLVNAARMVKPRVLFPYHYGETDVTTVPTQLKADGIDVRIRHYE